MFLATYNQRRIDLTRGVFFNYEGANIVHFLLVFPLIGLPVLIYLPFAILWSPEVGLLVLGLLGLVGMFLSEFFIRLTVRQFNARKYKILNGFRTK